MRIIRHISAVSAVALLGCCTKLDENINPSVTQLTVTAVFAENDDTRTTLHGMDVYWEVADEIKIFYGDGYGRFVSVNEEEAAATSFTGSINADLGSGEGLKGGEYMWGLYPYRSDATYDGTSVTTVIPHSQTGKAGSFAKNMNISIAKSSNLALAFYNVCGGVRFSVTRDDIEDVVFEGRNDEDVAGTVNVSFSEGVPAVQSLTYGQKKITLTAPDGGTFEKGKFYYIIAAPGALSNGFKLTFNTAAQYAELVRTDAVTVKRGIFGSIENADDGLTFRTKDTPPSEYQAPTYVDNYVSIAGWDNRSKWNLSNVHDPTVMLAEDGYYYMYQTDASYGNAHDGHGHFHCRRSKNLVDWEYLGGTMDTAPSWVLTKVNEFRSTQGLTAITEPSYGYWAPCARKVRDGLYRMYYCIVLDNYICNGKPTTTEFDGSWTERAFIGLCETSDPASNKWEDKGFVTCSSSDKGRDGWTRTSTSDWNAYFYYNAIDPTYIIAPTGKHYLIHGSWHSGFSVLELNAETGKPVNTLGKPWSDTVSDLTSRYGLRVGTRKNGQRWQASEAPEVIYKDGWYYLFMAYDALAVPYNTRVVRSQKIEGPYYDIKGKNFTNGEGDCYPIVTHPYKFSNGYGWVGISHCCVFEGKTSGEWFFSSQGRLPENVGGIPVSNAIMMGQIRRIVWCPASKSEPDNLWPIALPERYGAVPSTTAIKSSDLVGKWEHINLSYNYGVQDAAKTLNIKEDGTLSGAISGKWSYDATTKRLTLGSYVVCVEREVDWEATPRAVTIVYAGTDKSLNATLWGKKVE